MAQCGGLTLAVGAMVFNFLDKGKKKEGELRVNRFEASTKKCILVLRLGFKDMLKIACWRIAVP